MFALIIHGRVHELFAEHPRFPDDMRVVDVSHVPDVAVGWDCDAMGGVTAPGPASVAKDELTDYADLVCSKTIERGITVHVVTSKGQVAVHVDTNDTGLARLSRNLQLGTLEPTRAFDWAQSQGAVKLTVRQMQEVAKAAYKYEQDCWSLLSTAHIGIESGSITSHQCILDLAWPSTTI
jgi:hypothetical protein